MKIIHIIVQDQDGQNNNLYSIVGLMSMHPCIFDSINQIATVVINRFAHYTRFDSTVIGQAGISKSRVDDVLSEGQYFCGAS